LGGGHARSSDLFIGRQEIYSVIKNESFPFFTGDRDSRWAIVCDPGSRAGLFLREVGVKEWTFDDLLESVKDKFLASVSDDAQMWIAKRDDKWMQEFDALLYRAIKAESDRTWQYRYGWESSLNTTKYRPSLWTLIRTANGDHFNGYDVYLS